jgi:phosphatidylglycerophosphatase A
MRTAGAPTGLHPLARLVATGCFLGYSPVAPGTAGTLGCAFLLWFAVPSVTLSSGPWAVAVYALSVLAFVAMAVWASTAAERAFGKDSPRIVIDEFAGFLVAVLFLPKSVFVFIAAFVLFRLADILKPFPARRAELLPEGLGIVADDLVAGLYANVLLRIMMAASGW